VKNSSLSDSMLDYPQFVSSKYFSALLFPISDSTRETGLGAGSFT
jgi:hypothetical protein